MKKTIFYGAIIIVIGICILLVFEKHENLPISMSEGQQTHKSMATNNLKQLGSISHALVPKSAPKQLMRAMLTTTNEPTQQRIESSRTAFNIWSNQIQRPIEFYGKVVDENTQPVEGATISISCNQHISETYVETNIMSDFNGLFSIEGLIGSTLGVRVQKRGYYSVKSNPYQFDYRQILNTASFQPDPSNPVIFHLRRKGVGADLISAALDVKIPRDGTSIFVDFLDRSSGTSGQLRLSQIKPSYENWKRATEWSFKMEIPNGGFIEENDEFPFEAPEGGYQSTIDFDFKAGQSDWKTRFIQNYYIVFGSPPRYGRLTAETDITWGGARITYVVNPDGSRYLEPK